MSHIEIFNDIKQKYVRERRIYMSNNKNCLFTQVQHNCLTTVIPLALLFAPGLRTLFSLSLQ